MQGKTCLITGATSGIGLETARGLAAMGARLFIHGRDPQKVDATLEDIHRSTNNDALIPLVADLSSQANIHKMAKTVYQKTDKLDVLINNAGAVNMIRQLSPEGIELTFAVNYLAYYLLTFCLSDLILASKPSRIINVSSSAHGYTGLEVVNDPMFENNYEGWQAYSRSKLCEILFTYELASRLVGSGVTVNALHPGFVNSNIGKNNTPEQLANTPLRVSGNLTNQEGAQTSIYLASSSEVEGITGNYFVNCKPVASSAVSYDKTASHRLWEISARLTGQDPDRFGESRRAE
jgi:NAD(P)-dependent dehydrogenase (short-subunit alcohol dehydrogenase family)